MGRKGSLGGSRVPAELATASTKHSCMQPTSGVQRLLVQVHTAITAGAACDF